MIWLSEQKAAQALIEDSLTLTRAGAFDPILGLALSLAAAIRARNGDLPGALAVQDEATIQQHGDGNRLGLGIALQRAAAVLAGAVAARFALSLANIREDERLEIDQAQAPARRALGQAACSTALQRGAEMDDHEVTEYALGQFRRLAALLAEPARGHRNQLQARRGRAAENEAGGQNRIGRQSAMSPRMAAGRTDCPFCTRHSHDPYGQRAAQNGGYLRGRTKTQVALRDRLPVSLRPRPTALTTAG